MSVQACAELVHRGDPDRFAATMAAPVPVRDLLFPLFAFNLEVARAPWVTQEAMIAEMRLQWWHDALEEIATGQTPRRHEVVTPLADAIDATDAARLQAAVAARRWDVYAEPFEDQAHFDRYLDETAGTLLWTAARACGATGEQAVRDVGFATGLANWFLAIPELQNRGKIPLVDGRPEAVAELARRGLQRLNAGVSGLRSQPPSVRPAMLSAWRARGVLRAAADDPRRVGQGALAESEFRRRFGLIRARLTGRL